MHVGPVLDTCITLGDPVVKLWNVQQLRVMSNM